MEVRKGGCDGSEGRWFMLLRIVEDIVERGRIERARVPGGMED